MIYEEIGRRIALFRKERGLTAQELAGRIGLSQGQISRLENGKQGLRSETLLHIAEALGVPPVQFFMPMGEEDETAAPIASDPLRKALVDPGFVTLVEDLAAAYHESPSEFETIKSVVTILLKSVCRAPKWREDRWSMA